MNERLSFTLQRAINLGITESFIATLIDVDQSTISRWTRGVGKPHNITANAVIEQVEKLIKVRNGHK